MAVRMGAHDDLGNALRRGLTNWGSRPRTWKVVQVYWWASTTLFRAGVRLRARMLPHSWALVLATLWLCRRSSWLRERLIAIGGWDRWCSVKGELGTRWWTQCSKSPTSMMVLSIGSMVMRSRILSVRWTAYSWWLDRYFFHASSIFLCIFS